MARIRELAAVDSLVGRLLSAAFTAMEAATRNQYAAEVLPGGICAADSITAEDRERLSGMAMTSTGAERLFCSLARARRPRWSQPRRHACGCHPWPRRRHRDLDARARQRRGRVEAAA
eukprot:2656836-Pleurochrysis_carterae.AAC.1